MSDRIPLVLLPGLLCDERLWRDQANDLADVADSTIPDLTLDGTVSAMAARVLNAAPERFALAALSRPLLASIAVPTLVAVGDSDILTPLSDSQEIHGNIAGSTLHVFSACGHLPPMEIPEETSSLLRRWLLTSEVGAQ